MENTNKSKQGSADFIALITLLWSRKRRIILNCFWGGILSIIIAFSIPKEFTSTVVIAPEIANMGGISGGLGALASMAGINMDTEDEAIYPQLYPQIVSTTPFLCDLMTVQINAKYKKDSISTSLYNYLSLYQKETWWGKILSSPTKLVLKLKHQGKDSIQSGTVLDPRRLSRRQQILLKKLDERLSVELDKQTSAIYIRVLMQDASVAADIADTVTNRLQEYVVNYRTAKARKDLENTQRMFDEARQNYYTAQKAYAEYCDQHQGVTKLQYLIEQQRLENEQDLSYGLYNQIAQQLDLSRTKLLEQTPVLIVLQPSTVPYKATTPKKMVIGLLFVFLAFFGTCAWYIVEDRILKQ